MEREEQQRNGWLVKEVDEWQRDGIINEVQAKTIKKKYPVTAEADGNRLISVLTIAGSLLLGLGVILFFAANWATIPKAVKLLMIFSGISIAYGVGYYLAFHKESYVKLGRSLIFLGAILYGSGIWLTAQIFHISAHYPNAFLIWAIGILPIAFVCNSLPVLALASGLMAIWNLMEQLDFVQTNTIFVPVAAIILLLAYRMKAKPVVVITSLSSVIWVAVLSAVGFDPILDSNHFVEILSSVTLAGVLGILIYMIGESHSRIEKLAYLKPVYNLTGLVLFMMSLFFVTFKSFNQEMARQGFNLTNMTTAGIIAFLLSIGLIIYMVVMQNKAKATVASTQKSKGEALPLIAVAISIGLLFMAPYIGVVAYTIAQNVYLFAAIILIIYAGYNGGQSGLINVGLFFFVLDVIARYFDLFWAMMDRSVFFIIGGVILLAGGTFLERKRRKLLQELQVKKDEE